MKRLQTLLLAFTLFVGGTSLASAQSKVAHFDSQEILKTFPAYIAAQDAAKKVGQDMAKTADAQYNDMLKTLQNTATKYQNEAGTQTEDENKRRKEELDKMQVSLAEFQQQSQYNIEKAQFEKLQPVQKQVRDAVNKVAKTLGYDYVFDLSALIVANGKDITAEVKKELGY